MELPEVGVGRKDTVDTDEGQAAMMMSMEEGEGFAGREMKNGRGSTKRTFDMSPHSSKNEKEVGEPCVPSRPKKSRHRSPSPRSPNNANTHSTNAPNNFTSFDDPAVLQKAWNPVYLRDEPPMYSTEACLSPRRVTSLKKIKRSGRFLNIFLVQWCGYQSSGVVPPPSWLSEAVLDERYPRLVKEYYKNRRPKGSVVPPTAEETYLQTIMEHSA